MVDRSSLISLSKAIRSLDEVLKTHIQTIERRFGPVPVTRTLSGTTAAAVVEAEEGVVGYNRYNRKSHAGRRNSMMPGTKGVPAISAPPVPSGRRESALSSIHRDIGNRMKVSISVIFMKIGVIDTIHDRYSAEVIIQSKWREPLLDRKKIDSDNIDWDQYWNPRLSIENGIGEPKSIVTCMVNLDRNAQAIVCENRRVNGQFFEFMELNQFPFDSQDLTVSVISEWDQTEVELEEDANRRCGINAQAFSAEQEWSLSKSLNVWKKTITKTTNNRTMNFPGFCVAAKARRRPQFFIWNIIVIMCAICSLAFVTFTVNLETPQFRLQLTFILLLTTVTFKFVVNKSLPRISYLTYLDKYILGSMVILCCICVWHAVIGSIIYTSLPKAGSVVTATTTTPATTAIVAVTYAADKVNVTTIPSDVCATTTAPSPGSQTMMADKIALGILSFTYVAFHVVFAVLILCVAKHVEEDDKSTAVDIK